MNAPKAGWYPDPAGGAGRRYWDGSRWLAPAPAPVTPAKPVERGRWVLWIVVGFVVVGVIALAAIGHIGGHKTTGQEMSVIDTCQDAARQNLRDPDSARFSDWTAAATSSTRSLRVHHTPQSGDTVYQARGNVNAKNGFGGYNGDRPYQCDAVVSTDGDTYAVAWPLLGD